MASGKVGEDGKLEGEAADTGVLDMNETERFEIQKLSMEQADAGAVMEPFNMNSERREGTFDDDFVDDAGSQAMDLLAQHRPSTDAHAHAHAHARRACQGFRVHSRLDTPL